jgi:hypothetical protein
MICARVRAWLFRTRQRLGDLNRRAFDDFPIFFNENNGVAGDLGNEHATVGLKFAQNSIHETQVFF